MVSRDVDNLRGHIIDEGIYYIIIITPTITNYIPEKNE